jgi:hypothetical protein
MSPLNISLSFDEDLNGMGRPIPQIKKLLPFNTIIHLFSHSLLL